MQRKSRNSIASRISVEYKGKEYGVVLCCIKVLFVDQVKEMIVDKLLRVRALEGLDIRPEDITLYSDHDKKLEIKEKKIKYREEFFANLIIHVPEEEEMPRKRPKTMIPIGDIFVEENEDYL